MRKLLNSQTHSDVHNWQEHFEADLVYAFWQEEVCSGAEGPHTPPKQDTPGPFERTAGSSIGCSSSPSCSYDSEESSSEQTRDRLRFVIVAKELRRTKQEVKELVALKKRTDQLLTIPLYDWVSRPSHARVTPAAYSAVNTDLAEPLSTHRSCYW